MKAPNGSKTLRVGEPEEVGMSSERLGNLSALCDEWVESGLHGAIATVIARKGVIVHQGLHGKMGPEKDASPVKADTLFPLVCGTKTLTATAVMMLVEEGRVGLYRPIEEYIPEFTGGKGTVSLQHVLTHSAGLREGDIQRTADAAAAGGEDKSTWGQDDYYRFGLQTPFFRQPRTMVEYHHFGYELAKMVVERVSGQSLAQFVQERIFDKIGMHNSYCSVPASERGRIVRRPADAPGQRYDPAMYPELVTGMWGWDKEDHDLVWGAVGAYSTAYDIACYLQMFMQGGAYGGNRLLSPATVRVMRTNQNEGLGFLGWADEDSQVTTHGGWGLGFNMAGYRIDRQYGGLPGRDRFSHSGWGGIDFWGDPDYDLVAAFFSVENREHPIPDVHDWGGDLFEAAVTATIEEI